MVYETIIIHEIRHDNGQKDLKMYGSGDNGYCIRVGTFETESAVR